MHNVRHPYNSVYYWFKSYLSSRSFRVRCSGSLSSPHNSLYGVLQGSVLGPLLFILYTTPLSTLISSHSLDHHLYADDTQIFLSTWCCMWHPAHIQRNRSVTAYVVATSTDGQTTAAHQRLTHHCNSINTNVARLHSCRYLQGWLRRCSSSVGLRWKVVTTCMGDYMPTGKPTRYITNTKVNSAWP